jgi:hypothetical protein
MNSQLIQCAELGECRLDLIRISEGSAARWVIFFHTPTGPRIEILSRALRRLGGRFGGVGDQLGIVYDGPNDAHAAFGFLLETIVTEAGGGLGVVLRPDRDSGQLN